MNYRLILKLLGSILLLEALTMFPSLVVSMYYGDGDTAAILLSILITASAGLIPALLARPQQNNLRLKEGFLTVSLAWILLSLFGALPLLLSGLLPSFADALFESVSGLTTTGATVLTRFASAPRGVMFWRAFMHWIGGMGVLVLTLAILPSGVGRASHLMRAESPGPEFSKILPKTGSSAKVLYVIYAAMTALEFLLLLAAGLSPFDAAIHAMSTAGTGGFSNYAASVGELNNIWADVIITVFMVLFSVNFALYYRILTGHLRDALKSEELHWFLAIFLLASIILSLLITPVYGNLLSAIHHGFFQVASVMSTSGFATTDFNLWPQSARMLLVLLMFIGACAGSTAGGLKVVRVALLSKMSLNEVRRTFQPRKVSVVRFEGHGVDKDMLSQISVFFFAYIALILIGAFLLSLGEQFDFETNFTAALTCVSNVGPGLGAVGPMSNFSAYAAPDKLLMCVLMLAGRLEIFPILLLFHPAVWKRGT